MSERLILHHTYDRGVAFDVSEHGNHGELLGGVAPAAAYGSSMQFGTEGSYVRVPPSKTLIDLRSVRVRVRFMWVPDGDSMHVHNLVEGDWSFSLEVTPLGMLIGQIVDHTGTWADVRAPIGTVDENKWFEAELYHDGISHVQLSLDDTPVAERYDLPGPVRAVGSFGVGIGQYPHPWFASSFEGYIDDVKIWAYDPEPDVRDLLDECCVDRPVLDDLLHALRAAGWNTARAGDLVRELFDLGAEVSVAMRAGDPARTAVLEQLSRDGMLALMRTDLPALADTFGRVQDAMRATIPEAQIIDYGVRALDQVARSPFADALFEDGAIDLDAGRKLAAILCLDRIVAAEPADARPPERPRRTDGDRDTDGLRGERPDDWDTGRNPSPPDEPGLPNDEPHVDDDDDDEDDDDMA